MTTAAPAFQAQPVSQDTYKLSRCTLHYGWSEYPVEDHTIKLSGIPLFINEDDDLEEIQSRVESSMEWISGGFRRESELRQNEALEFDIEETHYNLPAVISFVADGWLVVYEKPVVGEA